MLSGKLPKKRVCVTLTKPYLDALDRLVREGVYVDRAELIKDALRRLMREEKKNRLPYPLDNG